MDFTRDDFIRFWGESGYREGFGEKYPFRERICGLLDSYGGLGFTALDIGCGDGYWTCNFLCPRFKKVVAIDILTRPSSFNSFDVEYLQLQESRYDCSGIPDNSIDFAWSFGMFCHLSNSATKTYLKNIFRVMRPGSQGLLMFANWPRGQYKNVPNGEDYRETHLDGWFYSDIETVRSSIEEAGLVFIEDAMPDFRDTLARIGRPS